MSVKKFVVFAGVIFMVSLMFGCSSIKVKRTDVEKTVDLSGKWNDTDSRLVSEEMIKDCLARPWLNDFNIKQGKTPVVIIGTVMNRTDEHIDSRLFTSDLEKNLINSGKVKFVAAKQERQEIRDERQDQQSFSSKETAKPFVKETGADFMVQGSINSVKDEIEGKYVILYQVNLELIDLATNEKAWIGQKQIKKIVSRRAFGL
ncbi:MAG: penicillin-binding protein activator LpoB [Candidatus Omnitrophota bacterium]